MAKRIKWTTNEVEFNRGNRTVLIAKLDNCKVWLSLKAYCTTQAFKSDVRNLAQTFGATMVEIKPAFNNDIPAESNVVEFLKLSDGYWFSTEIPVPEGAKRKIKEYKAEELFY